VLEVIDVSFGENHLKLLVFMRVKKSVFTKTLQIPAQDKVTDSFFEQAIVNKKSINICNDCRNDSKLLILQILKTNSVSMSILYGLNIDDLNPETMISIGI